MPLANTPEVFGLHPNAEIGYYTSAAKEMWSHLIDLQPQTGRTMFCYVPSYQSNLLRTFSVWVTKVWCMFPR